MKHITLFLLGIIILFSCNTKHRNLTEYKDADLLFKYIDTYHSEEIKEPDYVFATYRTRIICTVCTGKIDLYTLLDTLNQKYPNVPHYIVSDSSFSDSNENISFIEKNKQKYKSLKNIFYEDGKVLEQHGLYDDKPCFFNIKNNNLVEAMRFVKKF